MPQNPFSMPQMPRPMSAPFSTPPFNPNLPQGASGMPGMPTPGAPPMGMPAGAPQPGSQMDPQAGILLQLLQQQQGQNGILGALGGLLPAALMR